MSHLHRAGLPDCRGPPGITRLRELVRTALVATACIPDTVRTAIAGSVSPVAVHRMSDLSPHLGPLLRSGAEDVWWIRPDRHIAAVTVPGGVTVALGLANQPVPR
jgi:hypothetical protein